MPEVQYKVDLPAFTGRNVPIKEIAQAMGKDAQYVRVGLQQGILKFGTAIKVGNSNEFSYYCPDKKVWEETGYFRDVSELARVGNGLYCLPDNNARPYDHEYSDLAVEVTSLMQKKLTSLLFIRIICINYRLDLFHQSIIVILVINSTEHRITHNITVSVN